MIILHLRAVAQLYPISREAAAAATRINVAEKNEQKGKRRKAENIFCSSRDQFYKIRMRKGCGLVANRIFEILRKSGWCVGRVRGVDTQ